MEAAFAAELAAGMESLMKELSAAGLADPAAAGSGNDEEARKAFERMIIQDLEGGGDALLNEEYREFKGAGGVPPPGGSAKPEDAFQKTIKEAVERLKNSDDTLKVSAFASGS